MTTLAQEIFSYEGAYEHEDLTLSLIVVLALVVFNWKTIVSMTLWGVKKLILVVDTLISVAVWLFKQLCKIQSLADLVSMLFEAKAFTAMTILESHPGHFVSAVLNWYFPFDNPALTIIRISITLICYMSLDSFLISPLRIPSIMLRNDIGDVVTDWKVDWKEHHLDMQEDINHESSVALFIILVSIIIFLWLLFEAVPSFFAPWKQATTSAAIQTKACKCPRADDMDFSLTPEAKANYVATIRNVEVHLKRERAAAKAANKDARALRVRLESESARRIAAEEAQSHASAVQRELREQLIVKTTQLQRSHASHRDVSTQHDSKIRKLEKENAELRDEYESHIEANLLKEKALSARILELETDPKATQSGQLVKMSTNDEQGSANDADLAIKLTKRLEQQIQVEKELRREIDSLNRNFASNLNAMNRRAVEEYMIENQQLKAKSIAQDARIRELANCNIEADNAKFNGIIHQCEILQNELNRVSGEITSLQIENQGLKEVIELKDRELDDRQGSILGLEMEIDLQRDSLAMAIDPQSLENHTFEHLKHIYDVKLGHGRTSAEQWIQELQVQVHELTQATKPLVAQNGPDLQRSLDDLKYALSLRFEDAKQNKGLKNKLQDTVNQLQTKVKQQEREIDELRTDLQEQQEQQQEQQQTEAQETNQTTPVEIDVNLVEELDFCKDQIKLLESQLAVAHTAGQTHWGAFYQRQSQSPNAVTNDLQRQVDQARQELKQKSDEKEKLEKEYKSLQSKYNRVTSGKGQFDDQKIPQKKDPNGGLNTKLEYAQMKIILMQQENERLKLELEKIGSG